MSKFLFFNHAHKIEILIYIKVWYILISKIIDLIDSHLYLKIWYIFIFKLKKWMYIVFLI